MRLFALVFLRLKRFLCWFLSFDSAALFLFPDFQQNFTTTSTYMLCICCTRGNKQVQEPWATLWGWVTKGGHNKQQQQQPHTSIANCLVVLAIWEDALVIVVCYTWVLAAFSLVRCSHWILFLACFKACGFLCCALAKNKGWHHPKQTKHQIFDNEFGELTWILQRGQTESKRVERKRGLSTSHVRKRNKHFVCAIKVPLLLPSPPSPSLLLHCFPLFFGDKLAIQVWTVLHN